MVVGGVRCTRAAVVGSSCIADVALVDRLFVGSSYNAFLGDACLAHTDNSDLTSNAINDQIRSFCGSTRCSFHIVRSFTQVFPSLRSERYLGPSGVSRLLACILYHSLNPRMVFTGRLFAYFFSFCLIERFPSGSLATTSPTDSDRRALYPSPTNDDGVFEPKVNRARVSRLAPGQSWRLAIKTPKHGAKGKLYSRSGLVASYRSAPTYTLYLLRGQSYLKRVWATNGVSSDMAEKAGGSHGPLVLTHHRYE